MILHLTSRGERSPFVDIDNDEGNTIARSVDRKVAHRIVACVNACAEIEDAELEAVSYVELLASHQAHQQQRDELQATLKELRMALDPDDWIGEVSMFDFIDAAIAKVKGK